MSTYQKDQYLIFKGYSESVDAPILTAGQVVQVLEYSEEEDNYSVVPVGVKVKQAESIFEEEVSREATEEEVEAALSPKRKTATTKKAVAKAAEKPATKATPAKKTAPAKKATTKQADVATAAKKAPAKAAPTKKTAAAKKVESAPVETVAEEVTTESSTAMDAWLNREDILVAAKELKEQIDQSYYVLGGVLSSIYSNKTYERLGYTGNKGFERYCVEELDIEYRKAMYLVNIYDYFTEMGLDYTRLSGIGWSKVKELVGKANRENFDELIEYAKNHTRNELQEYIRTEYVNASTRGGERARRTTFKFYAFEDQANMVTEAIDAFARANGLQGERAEHLSDALIGIIMEWSMLGDGVQVPIEQAVRQLESRYKVKLEVKE